MGIDDGLRSLRGARKRARRHAGRIVAGALLAAAVVAGIVIFAGRPVSPEARLFAARDLLVAHKPGEAMREVQRALSELREGDELRLKALQRAGQIADFHQPNKAREAVTYYRQLIAEFPSTPEAFDAGVRIGEILRERLGAEDLAEEQFASVVDAFANQAGVERLLLRAARIAVDARRYERAREYARRILTEYRDSELAPEAQTLLGTSLHLEGRHDEAAAAFEQVAVRWPRTVTAARALFEAGNCHGERADFNHAIARYIEALPDHPEPLDIQRNLDRVRKRLAALRAIEPVQNKALAFGGSSQSPARPRPARAGANAVR